LGGVAGLRGRPPPHNGYIPGMTKSSW
jgi:hypothetical protein